MNARVTLVRVVLVAGLFSALFGLHALTLTHYSLASCDEAHYSNVGAVFLERGVFGNDLTGTDRPIYQNSTGVGRIFAIGLALVYRLLGVSLFSTRLFSLAGYFLAIVLTYFSGRIFHPTTGKYAAALFALSWIAVLHSHSGRPDIWTAAGSLILLLASANAFAKPSVLSAAMMGLAGGLILDLHLNGIHFLAASGVIFLVWSVRSRKFNLWIPYGLGVGVGLFIWVWGHVLVGTSNNSGLISWSQTATQTPLISKLLDLIDWWWRQYWVGTRYESLLQGVFFALGVAALLLKRQLRGLALLAYIAISTLSFGYINFVKPDYYRVVWMPLVALVMAEGIRVVADKLRNVDWFQSRFGRWESFLPFALAAPLFVAYLLGDAYLLYKFRDVDYEAVAARFEKYIPVGSRVAAEATWWYGLGSQYKLIDDVVFEEAARQTKPQDMNAAVAHTLEQWKFDYVIYDGRLACYSDVTPAALDLKEVLDARCERVAVVDDEWFGNNAVYRCSYQN